MIIGVDHILIAVPDLELAIETYQRLGFQVLQGGAHPTMGTHNALVPLADGSYLELLAVRDRALAEQAVPFVLAALGRANRLAQFALESDDLEADIAAMRARGFEIGTSHAGERLRPDGMQVAWRAAFPSDSRYPFVIQDITPREVRIPYPALGIGQTLRLGCVHVGVSDLATALSTYQKLVGLASEDGRFTFLRGAIHLQSVNAEALLQITLQADSPLDLAQTWREANVEFNETTIDGIGLALEPVHTLGAPLQVTGRVG